MRKAVLTTVTSLAEIDESVIFIGSDLGPGVCDEMRQRHPDRFLMEGISEQHLIGFSAGLALEGYSVYINTIANFFTRRAFEQISLDLALHHANVCMIANGGGAVYAPLGPTHVALDDIGLMRLVPEATILAPCDAHQADGLLRQIHHEIEGPKYFRLGKGGDPDFTSKLGLLEFMAPVDLVLVDSAKVEFWVVCTGVTVDLAMNLRDQLMAYGYNVNVSHFPTIKPLDEQKIRIIEVAAQNIIVLEEHHKYSGFAMEIICSVMHRGDQRNLSKIINYGFETVHFQTYGSQKMFWDVNGLSVSHIWMDLVARGVIDA